MGGNPPLLSDLITGPKGRSVAATSNYYYERDGLYIFLLDQVVHDSQSGLDDAQPSRVG